MPIENRSNYAAVKSNTSPVCKVNGHWVTFGYNTYYSAHNKEDFQQLGKQFYYYNAQKDCWFPYYNVCTAQQMRELNPEIMKQWQHPDDDETFFMTDTITNDVVVFSLEAETNPDCVRHWYPDFTLKQS
jgi:hypothetical protein